MAEKNATKKKTGCKGECTVQSKVRQEAVENYDHLILGVAFRIYYSWEGKKCMWKAESNPLDRFMQIDRETSATKKEKYC